MVNPMNKKIDVLIVDDSDYARILLPKSLTSIGFRNITEASSGIEALKAMISCHVDVVMTGMASLAVLNAIK